MCKLKAPVRYNYRRIGTECLRHNINIMEYHSLSVNSFSVMHARTKYVGLSTVDSLAAWNRIRGALTAGWTVVERNVHTKQKSERYFKILDHSKNERHTGASATTGPWINLPVYMNV